MEENSTATEQTQSTTSPKHVVIFGKHEYILQNTELLLHREGFTTSGFLDVEDAEDYIRMNQADALLIGGGVEPHARLKLIELVQQNFKHIKVVEHFGGPATIIPELKKVFAE